MIEKENMIEKDKAKNIIEEIKQHGVIDIEERVTRKIP